MVSVEYSEAIVEVLDIIENSDEAIYKRIPNKLIEFWQKNKSTKYKANLDHSKPLNEMKLKEKTKDIITMIYFNYLCDENEKNVLLNTLKNNEEKYQQELREKYNTDNLFKNKEKNYITDNEIIENRQLIENLISNSIDIAKVSGIEKKELINILEIFWEDENE